MSPDEARWTADDTNPDAIEAMLRELLLRAHIEDGEIAPARVLNMIVLVRSGDLGAMLERLAGVGRYAASRLLLIELDRDAEHLAADVRVTAPERVGGDGTALVRETVKLTVGECHMPDLRSIAASLVVTDLPTLLWSPAAERARVQPLLALAQSVLIDSLEGDNAAAAFTSALELADESYVVDLSWLRTTPWRERLAAAFDRRRDALARITSVTVRHNPASIPAGTLLVGWLASRLGWEQLHLAPTGEGLAGSARSARRAIELALDPDPGLAVPGLSGMTVTTDDGWQLSLDRGAGGLQADERRADGSARRWTVPGASRGEPGVLGEGIRQALLRDPTYVPALSLAAEMIA